MSLSGSEQHAQVCGIPDCRWEVTAFSDMIRHTALHAHMVRDHGVPPGTVGDFTVGYQIGYHIGRADALMDARWQDLVGELWARACGVLGVR